MLAGLGSVQALDQPTGPSGAPAPKSGPFQPSGYVRVVDGDSIEVVIDGKRVAVAVLGIQAAKYGTACGDAARAQVQSMVGKGVVLQDEPGIILDTIKRRVYRVSTPDGQSVALALVSQGLARSNGLGSEAAVLAAAEAKARQNQTGCLWGGRVPSRPAAQIVSPAAGKAGNVHPSAAGTVPQSFSDEAVVSGLSFPTAFAFLPDGRQLVVEKAGTVRMVTGGTVSSTPVLDIHTRVNSYWDRGMIGIVVDPNFSTNHYFYVFYVYENDANDLTGPKSSQLVRFTLQGNDTADPSSGTVVLGTVTGAGCGGAAATQDCIPVEGISHAGGSLRFGSDGFLYVSTGDGSSFTTVDPLALRAQDVDSLAGKILRVKTDGKGISSNPFWDGNDSHTRSKVWAKGFRNPFRTTMRPGNPSTLYVGDVGWDSWEEVDVVPAGVNGGWPCYEGSHIQDGYQTFDQCKALYAQTPPTVLMPFREWDHHNGGGAALAGAFYTGTAFPPAYQGLLYYADYAIGWVAMQAVDANNQPSGEATQFAGALNGVVQIESGPDGALWYLAIASGELRKIRYAGAYTPLSCPDGQFRAEYFTNTKDLAGDPVYQECVSTIDYSWGYNAPFSSVSADNWSVRWTGRFTFGNGQYVFSETSDDGARIFVDGEKILDDWVAGPTNTVTASKTMTAGAHTIVVEFFEDCCPAEMHASWQATNVNTPPTPTITLPAAGTTFKVGDVIQLQGSAADDQDTQIPGTGLRWDVILKHCPGFGPECHDHPLLTVNGATGQFTVPDHGDGTRFEVRLTATDSGGLATTATTSVDPKTIQITLATSPTGGTIVYDGTSHTAPYTATTIPGSTHTISVQPPTGQQFVSWSQGGAQQQNVTVGQTNVTYTATYSPIVTPATACSPRPRVTVTLTPNGAGQRLVTVAVTSNAGTTPPNVLKSIQFTGISLATVQPTGGQAASTPFTLTLPANTTQTSFVVKRTAPGALMTRFTVTDNCGDWPTFVGAGPSAGW
ncbi:MAG: PQQ-dependent sugar dehydrogenase [Chloroflexota bacterium]